LNYHCNQGSHYLLRVLYREDERRRRWLRMADSELLALVDEMEKYKLSADDLPRLCAELERRKSSLGERLQNKKREMDYELRKLEQSLQELEPKLSAALAKVRQFGGRP